MSTNIVVDGIAKLHKDLENYMSRQKSMQSQIDAIDTRVQGVVPHSGFGGIKSPFDRLRNDDGFNAFRKSRFGNFEIKLDEAETKQLLSKTLITDAAVGASTSGVLGIDRVPGIVSEARQRLFMRNVLAARPTDKSQVDFVKVSSPMAYGSPQTSEGAAKWENSVTFTTQSEAIRTLASWIPASKQVLDDMEELLNYLTVALPYYVNLCEEYEILSGDGSAAHYHGLTHQATVFNSALLSLSKGWNKIDYIARAIEQTQIASELQPTFVVLNPADFWDIRCTKDSYGRYIYGDPQTIGSVKIFDLDPVVTNCMTAGFFLVGSGAPEAAELRDREGMRVEIATQHEDYFVKNLVAIRAERRACLVVKRPGSFIYSSLSQSPV
jgi:HK97 family phage major capsid protein